MYPQEFFFPTHSSHPHLLCQITLLVEFTMKADRTWHYSYHDFIGKNREAEMILCPSQIVDFFKTCPIYLMHLSIHIKLVRIASKMRTCSFFCFMLNNLNRGKFYNLYCEQLLKRLMQLELARNVLGTALLKYCIQIRDRFKCLLF